MEAQSPDLALYCLPQLLRHSRHRRPYLDALRRHSGCFPNYIQANDMGGSLTIQIITLNIVEALKVPPVIKSTPSEVASKGQNYGYALQTIDRDNDPQTWSLLYGP